MLACEIRSATAHDMASVTAIYEHFVLNTTNTLEVSPPAVAEMDRRRLSVLDRGLPYLVAELDDQIVGYAYASQFRPREGYRYTVEDSIYVRADRVGYGVGRKLLKALITACESSGCHRLVACICGDNPASVALHASQGFARVGTIPEAGFKLGRWIDMSMMQRGLDVAIEADVRAEVGELQQV
jgi:L-amino acid N-acyltransferase YncA